ncbi:MAG: DUF2804 domain-containing protein [Clostridia bacterium]|nr:DUF2804 domain-containing protein [Clostridia bacterium]
MQQHKVETKQKLLDQNGNIAEPGYATNQVWQYDRNDIKAGKMRIKEWDYYIITNQKYSLALTIADNGFAGAVSASFIDYEHASDITKTAIKLFPLGKMGFPSTPDVGDISAIIGKSELTFANDGKTRHLYGVYPKFGNNMETLVCDITLSNFPKDNMVIATPFAKDKHFYFNQKTNCMTAKGFFKIGDVEYKFEPKDSLGTLDWGRGVWTYENTWYWGSFQAIQPDGTSLGWNIGYGFGNNDAASENMVFVNGVAHKLDEITFNIPVKDGEDDFMAPWTFTSNDGRFEMQFEPIIDRRAPLNLGIIMMIPHQVFGKFTGKIVLDDGNIINVENLIGFAEKVHNKW